MCGFLQRGGGGDKKDAMLEFGKALTWSCGADAHV